MNKPSAERICFVIDEGAETRRRSEQVLKHIIGPAAENCGYAVVRSERDARPGIITHQIIQHLLDDPLVVADMTEHNPNVFYELAPRHAVQARYSPDRSWTENSFRRGANARHTG